ncbi:MAG: PilT/PilU family type 4a pilus ATPase [Verrucomicrobiales bacterium]|nr:PilT/PilU family type 4a pilus ATPase [Verrucomicrobiales bacterium]
MDIEASDLHLAPRNRPLFRISGRLQELDAFPDILKEEEMEQVAELLAGETLETAMPSSGSLDGALTAGDSEEGRFRFNIYRRLPGYSIALRRLENEFRTLTELGLPESLLDWCDLPDGLILVAGPTGSGKSTSLATLIDHINHTRPVHVITIEDPVEYLHVSDRALVDQRQIGTHARDFQAALVSSLRQDPDVILVGEIRERETIKTAITAAETGHLVFATVHAPDCAGAIQRIVSTFPADEHPGVLRQLSMNLRGVLTQHLVPADGTACAKRQDFGSGSRTRVLLSEILQVTPAVANLIAKAQFMHIASSMETGSRYEMQTLEQSLQSWVESKHLLPATALSYTKNPKVLEQRLARAHQMPSSRPAASQRSPQI